MPPNPPNLTITINDMYGFGDGNLAAGRMRVALFGTIERVEGAKEIETCKQAYLQGQSGAARPSVRDFAMTVLTPATSWIAASNRTAHPDARGWVPPGGPHSAFYARFRVQKVYAFVRFFSLGSGSLCSSPGRSLRNSSAPPTRTCTDS